MSPHSCLVSSNNKGCSPERLPSGAIQRMSPVNADKLQTVIRVIAMTALAYIFSFIGLFAAKLLP